MESNIALIMCFLFSLLKVKPQLEEKTNETYQEFEAVEYKTQVVAGINYYIKVRVQHPCWVHLGTRRHCISYFMWCSPSPLPYILSFLVVLNEGSYLAWNFPSGRLSNSADDDIFIPSASCEFRKLSYIDSFQITITIYKLQFSEIV